MIKIYLPLHNAGLNFKKHCLWLSIMLFVTLLSTYKATAQCPVVSVSPVTSCGGVIINGGPCTALTASGNADTYVWSPLTGLYTDCAHTNPYNGSNVTTVYAAPTSYTVYTVTGTILSSGCSSTASARVNYTPPAPLVTPNPAIMCTGAPAVKLKVGIPAGTLQHCSGTINIQVPDNDPIGASSSVVVSGYNPGCTVTELSVVINMLHPRISDMVFVLQAPNGQVINLDAMINRTQMPGANFNNTIISTAATQPLGGAPPFTGTYADDAAGPTFVIGGNTYPGGPAGMIPTTMQMMDLVIAGVINGAWKLGFYDGITGETGTLTSWCLRIRHLACATFPAATPVVWSPIAGLYTDPAATTPYVGTEIDSVWARPIPAGTYTYTVLSRSSDVARIGFTNPASLNVPGAIGGAASVYPSNVTVSGLPTTGVRVASVVLHDVSHTRATDMDILLQSPSGQNVVLMSDVGTSALNNTFYFKDYAPAMNAGGVNLSGTYRPTNADLFSDTWIPPGPGTVVQPDPRLLSFGSVANVNGTWKLFVMDDNLSGDQGVIAGGFTIYFDTVAFCYSLQTLVPVTVGAPTVITAQPVNQTICANGSTVFSVGATGSGIMNYQWQVSTNGGVTFFDLINGGIYNGVTSAILSIAVAPVSLNGYYYRVRVNGSSACAPATSTSAVLTVNPVPVITITANPLIIGPTQTTTIFSTVTPNPAATYTWYYNNTVIPGAVSSSLMVTHGSPGDYQLKVTDVNGCTELSNIVTITNSFALNMFTYPNPSGGVFQVRYQSEANTVSQRMLVVYNNRGEKVITRQFTQTIPYQRIDVDIRAKGKGLYWVELRDAEGKRLAINRVVVQ
jgi:subtilisin-like proprotein convertase family protein